MVCCRCPLLSVLLEEYLRWLQVNSIDVTVLILPWNACKVSKATYNCAGPACRLECLVMILVMERGYKKLL